ncbi:hypothetical protein E2P81_ATG10539 [Venturia nashicola]|nr:hypothetical protein E2P81_ATG10539 [Venturia nashicola]
MQIRNSKRGLALGARVADGTKFKPRIRRSKAPVQHRLTGSPSSPTPPSSTAVIPRPREQYCESMADTEELNVPRRWHYP